VAQNYGSVFTFQYLPRFFLNYFETAEVSAGAAEAGAITVPAFSAAGLFSFPNILAWILTDLSAASGGVG
jgi:hypothetical protein